MSAIKFIQIIARKKAAEQGGKGITTIGNRMQAEAKAGEIAETFRASGLTPDKWDQFIKSEKDVIKYLNIIESTRKQAIEEATKKSKDILKVTKKKERPFTGWTPKVVERSMSADDYAALKEEWFSRIMTNTDEALNTFLKKGIDAADERFASFSKNQRKDFLDMVQYRLKHGNEKFMNDFTDAKGIFNKFPEDLAYGGLAGMLGERTGYFQGALADTEQGKSMSPGTRHDYTPGQGHRETAAARDLAEILKFHNMKAASMELKPPKKTIREKIGGGINRVLGNPLVRTYAAWGTGGASERLRQAMLARQLYENRDILSDEAAEEEISNIPILGGISPQFAGGGLAPMLGEPTYADDNHRVPFKDGKGPKMSRRGFLKTAAGLASIPFFGKFFKWAKPAAKVADLTSVPIKNAEGMPAWFPKVVNRVIKEGTETTKLPPNKGGAYLERQIVHSAELGEGQKVRVYQNLDDQTIRVEYQSADNMGGVDDGIVNLEYKAAEEIPTKKGSVKTKPTFEANEAYPYQDPKDYKYITFEGDNTVSNVDGLYSDTSALKQFGTGKNLSKKELAIAKQKRERVKKINEAPDEELGPLIDYPTPDDFATGGRVPFSKGKFGEWTAKGLAALMEKLFPGTTKLGQTSRPMAEKTQLKKAIADFQERQKAAKLKEEQIKEFTGDELSKWDDIGGSKADPFSPDFDMKAEADLIAKTPFTKSQSKKLKTWENPDKVRAAVDDIFSSGDYKMDAQMASEALVENNPKAFGGKLYDDLDDKTRSDIYGAVLKVVQSDLAKTLQLKKLSRPTKTLEGIKKTGTIDISDPNVADEFSRFMKETDPKGFKELEQKVELSNLDIKGKKGHAEGGIIGRVPYWKGGTWNMIKEAIKHNKVFGLGGPPYNPGATSFDIKQLTKDRFGKELSLKELKELAGENKELGRWSKDVLRKEEKFPDFITGFKEYKADVIKQQLLNSRQEAKLHIKVSKDMLETPPKGVDPALNKQIQTQMIQDSEKRLKDIDEALKEIDVYKAMKEKTGVVSHATGGRVSLSSGGLAGMLGE